MEFITDNIKQISSRTIRARFERELTQLFELNIIDPYCISIRIETDKENYNIQNRFIVNFYNIKDNNFYSFYFDNNYPFKPPKLEINSKPYSDIYYLNINSYDFKQKLLKYHKIRCLCCETKLCSDNWTPSYTMKHILNEIDHFKNICRHIIYRIIVDVIKRKYLIDDINIIEWL